MNSYQWIMFFIIFLLLFNKASFFDALILLTAYLFYEFFIVDLHANRYYLLSSMLNLIVGLSFYSRNKYAAICAYALVCCNMLGYLMWWQYYSPYLYDNIFLLILALQIIFILPKGLLNGLANIIKYTMAKFAFFNSLQSRVTLYKINSLKKKRK